MHKQRQSQILRPFTRRRFIGAALSAALLAGCAPDVVRANNKPASKSSGFQPAPVDSALVKQAVDGNSDFAFDLYRELASEEGNLFLSPHSISTALAMTWAGAQGETAAQMQDVMHFTLDGPEQHGALANLHHSLVNGGDAYRLEIANRLWGEQTSQLHEAFLTQLEAAYGAGLEPVSFKSDADGARKLINAWVEDNTEHKIKDLIPNGLLDPDTRLVLTNAIYFKGNWASQFDAKATHKAPFHRENGDVEVDMMFQEAEFGYGEVGSTQVLELPYEGDRLSMLAILPQKGQLESLEGELNADLVDEMSASTRKQDTMVWLPRFEVNAKFKLNDMLKKMGMEKAFDSTAEFDGMTDEKPLYIDAVLHKAYVKVNEEGTEAAAATAVVMTTESAGPPVPEFRADRPFLFLIRDNETGAILFMGRLMDPTDDGE